MIAIFFYYRNIEYQIGKFEKLSDIGFPASEKSSWLCKSFDEARGPEEGGMLGWECNC